MGKTNAKPKSKAGKKPTAKKATSKPKASKPKKPTAQRGRPTSTRDRVQRHIDNGNIAKWIEEGWTNQQIADKLGVSKSSWNKYKNELVDLKTTYTEAENKLDAKLDELEDVLITVALGKYEYDDYKVLADGTIIKIPTKLTPNTKLGLDLLRIKRPKKYNQDKIVVVEKRAELDGKNLDRAITADTAKAIDGFTNAILNRNKPPKDKGGK